MTRKGLDYGRAAARREAQGAQQATIHLSAFPGGCHLIAQTPDGALWQLNWGKAAWERLPDLPSAT